MSDYDIHARDLHRKATAAHLEWAKALTPAQREKLAGMGVLEPADDRHEVGGHSPWQQRDAAESHYARIEADPAENDADDERLADLFDIPLPTAKRIIEWHRAAIDATLYQREGDLLAIVVGGLLASQNPRLSAAGLAFATNLDATNGLGSQAQFARSLKISRQAVSKVTKAWQEDLGLQPGANQKSAAACAAYSQIGFTDHWRTKKASASALLARMQKRASLN
jgi:hypothetical protein